MKYWENIDNIQRIQPAPIRYCYKLENRKTKRTPSINNWKSNTTPINRIEDRMFSFEIWLHNTSPITINNNCVLKCNQWFTSKMTKNMRRADGTVPKRRNFANAGCATDKYHKYRNMVRKIAVIRYWRRNISRI